MRIVGIVAAVLALLLSAFLQNPHAAWFDTFCTSSGIRSGQILFVSLSLAGIVSAGVVWWLVKTLHPFVRALLVTLLLAAGFAPAILGGHGFGVAPFLTVVFHFREQSNFWFCMVPFLLTWIALLAGEAVLRFILRRVTRHEDAA
jgi:hypothetical protein